MTTLSPDIESTASKLERLSATVPAALNARDFHFSNSPAAQELLAHISPNFCAQLDTYAADSSPIPFSEQVKRWESRAKEYPDVRFDVASVTSQVNEYKGTANVWLSMEVTGMGEGVVLHAMNELRWRKEGLEGQWKCVFVIGLRGSPGNAGG